MASDVRKLLRLVDEATRKANRNRRAVEKGWDNLTTLFRMVRAYRDGRYRDIPWRPLVAVVAAVVYFVNPFDAISDVLPFVGYVDDLGVLSFVVASIHTDLEKFLRWEQEQTPPAKTDANQ